MTTPAARYHASLTRRYRCAFCNRLRVQASPLGRDARYCPKEVRPCKEEAHTLRQREKRQATRNTGKEKAS